MQSRGVFSPCDSSLARAERVRHSNGPWPVSSSANRGSAPGATWTCFFLVAFRCLTPPNLRKHCHLRPPSHHGHCCSSRHPSSFARRVNPLAHGLLRRCFKTTGPNKPKLVSPAGRLFEKKPGYPILLEAGGSHSGQPPESPKQSFRTRASQLLPTPFTSFLPNVKWTTQAHPALAQAPGW